MQEPKTLALIVEAKQLRADEVDDITRGLRDELLDTGIQRVAFHEVDVAPGSKGSGIEIGTLLVTILPEAIPALLAILRNWLQRQRRPAASIRVHIKDGEVSIGGMNCDMSPAEAADLTEELVAALRRAGRGANS